MHLWAHDPQSAQDGSTSSEKCTPVSQRTNLCLSRGDCSIFTLSADCWLSLLLLFVILLPFHLTPPLPPLLNMFLVSRFTIRNLHCLLDLVISYFHNKTFQNCSPVLFWKWVQFESFISFTASVPEGLAKSDISNLGNKLCVLGT